MPSPSWTERVLTGELEAETAEVRRLRLDLLALKVENARLRAMADHPAQGST